MPAPAKKALTEADIAAMAASGIAPAAVALATTTALSVAATTTPAAEGTGVAAPAAAAAAATATEGAPAAAAEGAAAVVAAAAAAPATDVTVFLQSQIATKDEALLKANVELTGLKAKIADSEASITGLKAIAATSISNMRVALGGSKIDLSALSATELLAQHATAKAEFETKFVAGGIAAVDATSDNKAVKVSGEVSQAEIDRLNRFTA